MNNFRSPLIPLSKRKDIPETPLVSVSCLVYNHEKFLHKTLEGFLQQQTDFGVEILIHDDASTDTSKKIIKEYQEKYPQIFKPVYQTQNQYQQGLKPGLINMKRAIGKYYAMCEGDDFWTDPLKLQKQVNFLESNPSFSLCCGGYIAKNFHTGEEKYIIQSLPGTEDKQGFDFGLKEWGKNWLTKTLTVLYRKDALDLEQLPRYKHGRDIHLFYHLLSKGKGYYFNEIFGVHNIHAGGVNSMQKGKVNVNATFNCYKEIHEFNKNDFTRKRALKAALALFNFDLYNDYKHNTYKKRFFLFKEIISLIKTPEEVWRLVNSFLPENLKDLTKGHLGNKKEHLN